MYSVQFEAVIFYLTEMSVGESNFCLTISNIEVFSYKSIKKIFPKTEIFCYRKTSAQFLTAKIVFMRQILKMKISKEIKREEYNEEVSQSVIHIKCQTWRNLNLQ